MAQDGERGGPGTNSSRRMRDNAAYPRSLICIHPVPFPAETATFCNRLPRQYLTGARRSTRLRGDVEMRIFRAAFRRVLIDRSRKSFSKGSIAGLDSSRISALCDSKDRAKKKKKLNFLSAIYRYVKLRKE